MNPLIIFDCDGVLVDSEFISSKVFSDTLSQYGYAISVEESIRRFTGVDEHSCRKIIMEESEVNIPADYWDKSKPALFNAFKTDLNPLMTPLLEKLEKMQMKRCVASNSSKTHVTHCLELTGQSKFFNENNIFTASLVKKPKPAPDLFLYAAKEMEVKPERCIVIEDSLAGATAALAAGMKVMIFAGGRHAHFDWYREKFLSYNLPVFETSEALSYAIQSATHKNTH